MQSLPALARFAESRSARSLLFTLLLAQPTPLDLASIPRDLHTPAMIGAEPAAGKRVKHTLPEYRATELFHVLYLPTDWTPDKKFPVLFEYPGNGPYKNKLGDTNSGRVEDCNLGYGISGGKGLIVVSLPFVNKKEGKQQISWWGDADATAEYCKKTVTMVCQKFSGDPERLILAGFSRGAIACNYIGLRDDDIAKLWRGFIVHSHYDGVTRWPYPDSDRDSARARLARLKGRPQFISHEGSVEATRAFLGDTPQLTLVALPFPNHTDTWVLRDIAPRQRLRAWLAEVLR